MKNKHCPRTRKKKNARNQSQLPKSGITHE
jgi:hypothetical protein